MPTADEPPLLMLPGTLCDARVFAAAAEGITRRKMVIEMAGARSAPEMAERVLALAPPRFALVGFSLGAIVALEMLAEAPERIERVALLGCNARAMPEERHAPRRASVEVAARDGMASYIDAVWENSVPRHRLTDAPLRALLTAMADDTPLATFAEQVEISINRNDRRSGLGQIAVPVLVACGAEDQICPPELSREIAGAIAGARLAILDGAGHYLTLDQPAQVAMLLADWLDAPTTARMTVSKEFS